MEPIASRLLLAIVIFCNQAISCLADNVTSGTGLRDPALPSFVPQSGRSTFKTAVDDNSPSAVAARRAAEELGAKFSDITTGSISQDSPAPIAQSPAPAQATFLPPPEADPPHVIAAKDEGRSIVLSSKHLDDAKTAKGLKKSLPRPTQSEARRTSHGAEKGRAAGSSPGSSTNGGISLAAIGQKVGFVELLTNPSLWHWPGSDTSNTSYANR